MHMWRFAVITYLRAALEVKVLASDLSQKRLSRYVRRPPIAQYRFVKITDQEVRFWFKDKILKRRMNFSYTPEEFVATLAEHVPDSLSTCGSILRAACACTNASTSAAVFTLLRQQKRPRPRRLGWAFLLRRDFGKTPPLIASVNECAGLDD
jgi:hypothetical protein